MPFYRACPSTGHALLQGISYKKGMMPALNYLLNLKTRISNREQQDYLTRISHTILLQFEKMGSEMIWYHPQQEQLKQHHDNLKLKIWLKLR
jgi:hypothetical protein